MAELGDHQLDHNGIVQKAEARYMIGNEIFGFAKVGKGIQNPGGIPFGQAPAQGLPSQLRQAEASTGSFA